MTATARDITFQLRQGKLVALADETGWSVAADPLNEAAVKQLMTLQAVMPPDLQPTIVIHNADLLTLYVAKMPDVAYDLVDFADKPLTVLYEQGKNVSPVLWANDQATDEPTANGELAIRRVLNADLQRLLGGFGRGVLTIPFEALTLPPTAEALLTERFGTLPGMPKRPRIVRLKANGEISFIRK